MNDGRRSQHRLDAERCSRGWPCRIGQGGIATGLAAVPVRLGQLLGTRRTRHVRKETASPSRRSTSDGRTPIRAIVAGVKVFGSLHRAAAVIAGGPLVIALVTPGCGSNDDTTSGCASAPPPQTVPGACEISL